MNTKKFLKGAVSVSFFVIAFEWIFHGVIMKDSYAQTAYLWRPPEQMHSFLPFMTMGQILFSFVFTYIFIKGYEKKGIGEGVRYGLVMGILFTGSMLVCYAVTPYPSQMVLSWIAATFVELILAGVILARIYQSKD